MTVQERITLAVMRYAYASARRCGETGGQALREAMEAKAFVKRVME